MGDHTLFVGEVLAAELGEHAPPLVHVGGGYRAPVVSVDAVVFDLDGVIVDSEPIWDEVREGYIREHGGRYDDEAQRAMMGMSSTEWSQYIHEELGVDIRPEQINADVVELMAARYREHLPLIRRAGGGGAHGVQLPVRAGLLVQPPADRCRARARGTGRALRVTVSSEESHAGSPRRRLHSPTGRGLADCVAVEDSRAGIRSAKAAGMRVVAAPSGYPLDDESLAAGRHCPRVGRRAGRGHRSAMISAAHG